MSIHRRGFLAGCLCAACTMPVGLRRAFAEWEEILPDITPGYDPSNDMKDEAGLWMVMEKYQEQLDRSAFVIRDAALNDYVGSIVDRLAGDYASDIKVYIVDRPFFNATMAPNGVMQIWSGLLLRMQSEAELAAVLGHEIAHYLKKHSLDRYRKARSTSSLMSFLTVGLGGSGLLAQMIAMAMFFSYSRSQESEADVYGLQLMARAGYDGDAATDVWRGMMDEDAAAEEERGKKLKQGSPMAASHPTSAARMDTLAALSIEAKALMAETQRFAPRYTEALRPHRLSFMEAQLELNEVGRTLFLLDRLSQDPGVAAEAAYFKGEVFRRRGEDGDYVRALNSYDIALKAGTPPPQLYRSKGLIHLKERNREAAKDAFTTYLALVPNAEDKAMIQFYVQ